MKVLVLIIQKVFKVVFDFQPEGWKKGACHCHRLAIGLIVLLAVVLVVVCFLFFSACFLLETLKKISQKVSILLLTYLVSVFWHRLNCPTTVLILIKGRFNQLYVSFTITCYRLIFIPTVNIPL